MRRGGTGIAGNSRNPASTAATSYPSQDKSESKGKRSKSEIQGGKGANRVGAYQTTQEGGRKPPLTAMEPRSERQPRRCCEAQIASPKGDFTLESPHGKAGRTLGGRRRARWDCKHGGNRRTQTENGKRNGGSPGRSSPRETKQGGVLEPSSPLLPF